MQSFGPCKHYPLYGISEFSPASFCQSIRENIIEKTGDQASEKFASLL